MSPQYLLYLKSKEWARQRTRCIALAQHKCSKCGRTDYDDGVTLQAHHKTYKRLFNEKPEDLECLCVKCHERETIYSKWRRFGVSKTTAVRFADEGFRPPSDMTRETALDMDRSATQMFANLDAVLKMADLIRERFPFLSQEQFESLLFVCVNGGCAWEERHKAVWTLPNNAAQMRDQVLKYHESRFSDAWVH